MDRRQDSGQEVWQREITFDAAYDKRHDDPKHNYGIHGVTMRFMLQKEGQSGAVGFIVYTNWMLPHVQQEMDSRPPDTRHPYLFHKPMPADLGYHSPFPQWEGQTGRDDCEYVKGLCYYDGSGLNAEGVFRDLLEGGSEAVWRHLEGYYEQVFAAEVVAP